jgi:hypothetical protein
MALNLDENVDKVVGYLRSVDRLVSLSEVASGSGLDLKTVTNIICQLVKVGAVKCFIREDNDGKIVALYVLT